VIEIILLKSILFYNRKQLTWADPLLNFFDFILLVYCSVAQIVDANNLNNSNRISKVEKVYIIISDFKDKQNPTL